MITKVSDISRNEAKKLDKNGKGGEWFGSYYSSYTGFTLPPLTNENFKNIWNLLCNNHGSTKKILKKIFGNQKYCVNGTSVKFWVWFLEYEDMIFSISCSILGTSFRVYNKRNEDFDDIYDKIRRITNEITERIK